MSNVTVRTIVRTPEEEAELEARREARLKKRAENRKKAEARARKVRRELGHPEDISEGILKVLVKNKMSMDELVELYTTDRIKAMHLPLFGRITEGDLIHWMRQYQEVVVVTRHPALLEYLEELDLIPEGTEILSHASHEAVRGKKVIGVLPLHLAAEAAQVVEIPLAIPPELRGQELTLEQLREFAGDPVTYSVTKE